LRKLIAAWIKATKFARTNSGESAEEWAIQEILDKHYSGKHEEIWQFILEVIDNTDSEWVLGCLGAGPLEDLIVARASEYFDRITNEVKRSAKFKKALAVVNLDADDTPLYKEIYHLADVEPPFE
jgi:hypothetical protein